MAGRRAVRLCRLWLPELNFITLHYLYFCATCLISAMIFWGSSTPAFEVSFTDSLFLCVSAMTESGLNTVNLSTVNTWQQCILFLLTLIGSSIFVSSFIVYMRRRAFEREFMTKLEKTHRLGRRIIRTLSRGKNNDVVNLTKTPIVEKDVSTTDIESCAADTKHRMSGLSKQEEDVDPENAVVSTGHLDINNTISNSSVFLSDTELRGDHVSFGSDVRFRNRRVSNERRSPHRLFHMSGVGARPGPSPSRYSLQSSVNVLPSSNAQGEAQNQSSTDEYDKNGSEFSARNSAFHDLTRKEREQLGGVEFKAVVFLSWLVPFYFVIFQLLGCLSLGAFVATYYASVTRENGLNPWWVGSFNAVSAFNNNGMSLLDANMTAFSRAIFKLLSMSLLILAGNTCFPIFLRFFIWIILKSLPKADRWNDLRGTLTFLLQHPRRCFTNLFPSQHTWWLLWSVIVLNGIDCVMFVVLNIRNSKITKLEPGYEFIDGLFQAIAVRSGGFYVVPIADTRISLQVLYVIMMYISAFPIAITIRNSNVYEERSLGIYTDDPGYDHTANTKSEKTGPVAWLKDQFDTPSNSSSRRYFVQQQLRAQLAHDLWWLGLAVFLIMIVEGGSFDSNPKVFSVFNVIFETVSAYGTVGLSVGLPDQAYSFSGDWHTLSKLILCAVMLRGRHRGLPVAIDKAVLLPQDPSHNLEEEDARIRKDKTIAAGQPLTV